MRGRTMVSEDRKGEGVRGLERTENEWKEKRKGEEMKEERFGKDKLKYV